MKLFCRDEMQRLEMAAVAAGVPLSQLMDNAGAAVAQEVERRCRPVGGKRAVVLCGKGNNGGDGFVCAKLLAQRGMACWVVLAQGKPATDLAAAAFEALPPQVAVLPGEELEQIRPVLEAADVLIDCVFGFSFRGELSGLPKSCWPMAAACPAEGLRRPAQRRGVRHGPGVRRAFRADVTVIFTGKKPANVSYPAKEFCGETVVRQVGVPAALVEGAETRVFEDRQPLPPAVAAPAGRPGQQGRHGQAAAGCAAAGAWRGLRYGGPGGLAQRRGIADHRRGGAAVPHPGPSGAPGGVRGAGLGKPPGGEPAGAAGRLGQVHACVMGCGLGQRAELVCPLVFSHCQRPLVADADAVNFLSRHPGYLEGLEIPWCSPLTPGRWPGCAMTPSRKSSPTGWALPGRRPRKPAPWWR